jgi:hypothetical protein
MRVSISRVTQVAIRIKEDMTGKCGREKGKKSISVAIVQKRCGQVIGSISEGL